MAMATSFPAYVASFVTPYRRALGAMWRRGPFAHLQPLPAADTFLFQEHEPTAWSAFSDYDAGGASTAAVSLSPLSSSPSGGGTAPHGGWRGFAASAASEESIPVIFVNRDGSETTVDVPLGENLLEAAHHNDIELEGACEGSLACSTCHLIVDDPEMYERIPEACEDEEDMLDLAFGLTETSRLGCQVVATTELAGLRVRLPQATRNMAVDGFVPKPH